MRSRSVIRIVILALVIVGLAAPPAPVAGADPPVPATDGIAYQVLAVSVGNSHTCAIRIDGTLACWGREMTPPTGTFTAVSAGEHHTCAIRTDGTLACWGDNAYNQATPPPGTFTAVSAGDTRTCAIRTDGTLACWGEMSGVDEDFGDSWELTVPSGTFSAVSGDCAIRTEGTLACLGSPEDPSDDNSPLEGTFSAVGGTCAIRTDGTLACWGFDLWEDLMPTPPTGTFSVVSAASDDACAIRTDGTLACWGMDYGDLRIPLAGPVTAVSASDDGGCAIRTDGTLACWGWNTAPRPGAAMTTTLPAWLSTTRVALTWRGWPAFAAVTSFDIRYRRTRWDGAGSWVLWLSKTGATGATFTATPGYSYCFEVRAHDADGLVSDWSGGSCTAIPLDDRSLTRTGTWTAGTGSAYYRSTYLRTSTSGATLTTPRLTAYWVALRATTCPTCGTVRLTWGSSLLNTISLYSPARVESRFIPVLGPADEDEGPAQGQLTIRVVSSGKEVTIDGVLATQEGVPAWADDTDPPAPATYRSGQHVLAVSAGEHHTCAIRTDGTLACWGDNAYGQATPPAGTFSAVSAGDSRSCAIRTDGSLACWGQMSGVDEDFGDPWQLTVPSGTFSAVSGDCAIRTDGTLICLSYSDDPSEEYSPLEGTFSALSGDCAIRTDGTLACWGDFVRNGAPPVGTYSAVSVGTYWHACAIRTDGTLACWGDNAYGQASPPAGTFTAVAAGDLHTCGIRADGTVACWGDNEYFELTPPEGTFTAIDAGRHHTCAIATDGTLACWGQNWSGQVTPRPTAAVRTLPTWLATTDIPLRSSATSALAPVTSYDVRYRRAAWNGDFGPAVTWLRATDATDATFPASPGSTYCFGVRARDADGVVSPWTAAGKCTAVPLDDRSLTRSSGWTAGTGSSYYRSTYLRSSTSGAKLTRTGVVAKRIALVATTCATCGTVKVYWGSTLLKTVSLHSDTTVNKKLIAAAVFPWARTGTLTIKVASSGKKVLIDGVAIRRN